MTTSTGNGWDFLGLDSSSPARPARVYEQQTVAVYGLTILLNAMGDTRGARSIAEAVGDRGFDQIDNGLLQLALHRLSYETSVQSCYLDDLDESRLPAIFHTTQGQWWVVLDVTADGYSVHDLMSREEQIVPSKRIKGDVLLAQPDQGRGEREPRGKWVSDLVSHAKGRIRRIAAVSLFINLLALATPIFVMTVYDRVVGSTGSLTLMHLLPGVAIALFTDLMLRMLRTELASQTSSELGYVSSTRLFEHLMSLPSALTERSTVSTQIMRLKGFDSIRRILSGTTVISLIDAPFVLIFLGAIVMIGGKLALVPLIAICIFVAIGFVLANKINQRETAASVLDQQRQDLVLETIEKSPSIRQTGTASEWNQRFDDVHEASALANAQNASTRAWLSSLGQAMTMGTGLATLLVGIGLVIDGAMSPGALIATVMLTWRVFAPVQAVFAAGPQIKQARRSFGHVASFLNLETDGDPSRVPTALPSLGGEIKFDRVTFRYGAAEPELANVSFQVNPGEVLGVVGNNGSGKSTVLKLLLGMYHPQAGRVLLDGRNLKQTDPAALRRVIAYAPQVPRLIAGSIAQNLDVAEPGVTRSDMWAALELAGARVAVEQLKNGLDTMVDPRNPAVLPTSLVARISLARAWIRPAPVVLLDEPTVGLDFESEYALIEAIESLRQRSTIVLVTHQTEHIGLCDKALMLDRGAVRFFGKAQELEEKLKA